MDYDNQWKHYRLRLTKADLSNKAQALRDLMKLAFERRAGR